MEAATDSQLKAGRERITFLTAGKLDAYIWSVFFRGEPLLDARYCLR